METLLHRAIAQGTPTRRVWITPEFVAERLGPGDAGGLRWPGASSLPASVPPLPELVARDAEVVKQPSQGRGPERL